MPGNFTVSVRAFDTVGNNATVGRTVRLVDTTAPEITLEMAKEVQAGENLTVKVKLVERTGIERVEYSTDGKEWRTMEPGAKGWTASIDTRALPLGKNRIRVQACDIAGNVGESTRDVTVADDVAPAVAIAELTVRKSSLAARGNATDNYRIKTVEYTVDDLRWTALEPSNGSWNLSLSGLKGGKYTLKVRATDMAGKTAAATRDFEIAKPAPAARGFLPGFGAGMLAAALFIGAGLAGLSKRAPRKG